MAGGSTCPAGQWQLGRDLQSFSPRSMGHIWWQRAGMRLLHACLGHKQTNLNRSIASAVSIPPSTVVGSSSGMGLQQPASQADEAALM